MIHTVSLSVPTLQVSREYPVQFKDGPYIELQISLGGLLKPLAKQ
jgi:hypothetical protein